MRQDPRVPTARERVRAELTSEITDAARRQLADVGAAALSLRAVAREVGMVSSAVYRYFPSRDDLLTRLIIDGYDALGEAAEAADEPAAPLEQRWSAVCTAVRAWARAHPHEYALLYGSPVPGYAAPRRTVEPAARVPRLVLALVSGSDVPSAESGVSPVDDRLHHVLRGIREFAGADLGDEPAMRALSAWSGLIGAISLELFGHLTNAVDDYDVWFAALADRLAPA
jgi:AcrR family transcriptional regulator